MPFKIWCKIKKKQKHLNIIWREVGVNFVTQEVLKYILMIYKICGLIFIFPMYFHKSCLIKKALKLCLLIARYFINSKLFNSKKIPQSLFYYALIWVFISFYLRTQHRKSSSWMRHFSTNIIRCHKIIDEVLVYYKGAQLVLQSINLVTIISGISLKEDSPKSWFHFY